MGDRVPDLTPDDVGRRVTVRRRDPSLPGPRNLRDTVGHLADLTANHLVVRRRDGEVVRIERAQVVASKVVPDAPVRLRRALDVGVAELERISSAGWPAVETRSLGSWLLRAAGGFTGRANSVLPLGSPGVPLDDALAVVVTWYRERDILPRFQVPLPLRADLDAELDARGWIPFDPVRVLVADVGAVLLAAPRADDAPAPEVASRPDTDWLATYHYREQEQLPPVARQIMAGGPGPLFVTLADDQGAVAVARGAVDGDWVGVTAVEVADRARRRGLGMTVMHDLLEAGRQRGARFTYLQVAEGNPPARALYDRLGYTDHHGYRYRGWDAAAPH